MSTTPPPFFTDEELNMLHKAVELFLRHPLLVADEGVDGQKAWQNLLEKLDGESQPEVSI